MVFANMGCIAVAALAYFNRTLYHYDIATGEEKVTANLTTSGPANATHTNSFVPITSSYVAHLPCDHVGVLSYGTLYKLDTTLCASTCDVVTALHVMCIAITTYNEHHVYDTFVSHRIR